MTEAVPSTKQKPQLTSHEVNSSASGLSLDPAVPLCVKCQYPTEPLNAVIRVKASQSAAAKYICRPCNSVVTMLARKCQNQKALNLKCWTPEHQVTFWRNASSSKDESGRLNYSKLRGLIVETLTERKMTEVRQSVSAEALPLNVWRQRGFDVDLIVKYNRKEWNDACGWCYEVPLKQTQWLEIKQSVEETMLHAEKNVSNNAASETANDLDFAEPNESHAVNRKRNNDDSGDEASVEQRPTRRANADKAAQKAKDKEKQKMKESAAIKKRNQQLHGLASKAVTSISVYLTTVESLKSGKMFAEAPKFLQEALTTCLSESKVYLAESDQVLKSLKKSAKTGSALPELSFDATQLAATVKSMKGVINDFKNFSKMFQKV